MLIQGDCLLKLKELASDSVDSVITDPPAGISFMGKAWDDDKGGRKQWTTWTESVMRECLRVLKPGGHALIWAIPRTSHWTATAVEDAGFEIRDVVTHLFGSGFPKSLDISKAIDKELGVKEWKETTPNPAFRANQLKHDAKWNTSPRPPKPVVETDDAKKWQGFGTALKPAAEFWILARKPLSEKTVAKNVLKHGTGGLNIDASRIDTGNDRTQGGIRKAIQAEGEASFTLAMDQKERPTGGRFPANLVLSGDAPELLDEQSGTLSKQGSKKLKDCPSDMFAGGSKDSTFYGDKGGASRFFYCAKVSSSERNAGLEDMPDVEAGIGDDRPSGQSMSRLDGRPPRVVKNSHPTVKPQKLMTYLIKLITPPGGTVLDPFMGSGSTGLAAKNAGFSFIGIEQEQEYFEIATKRIGEHV